MDLRRHTAGACCAATVAAAVIALAGAAAGAAAAAAPPPPDAHPYRHGVVPPLGAPAAPQAAAPLLVRSTNLAYRGGVAGVGVTTGPPLVYLVFWGSQWGVAAGSAPNVTFSGDPTGMAPYFQRFLAGLGTGGDLWSGVMTQYCQGVAAGTTSCPGTATHVGYPSGGALAGVWADTAGAAPSAATGHQLALEAAAAANHFAPADNRNAQYVIVSPTGTHPDGFNTSGGNFCAWHDYTGDSTLTGGGGAGGPTVAFTNLPYVTDAGSGCGANFVNSGAAGNLDGVSIVGGHEYAETITDQFPSGGWVDSRGYENGDKCAWIRPGSPGGSADLGLGTGSFAVQSTWGNDTSGCQISHAIVGSSGPSDFGISASPTSLSVAPGASATSSISTAVTGGSAQAVNLSVSGVPTGATASLSPASVTAGAASTLTVAAGTAAPGSYSLTVTGREGTASHTATVAVTVTAPVSNNFSISASPASVSVGQGSSTTSTISTAVTSGSAQTVALSATGLPSGASASLSPPGVTAGGSSTLTIQAGAATAAGSYTVTVTGTGSSATHTTTVALTVTSPATGAVVANGDFETGVFGPWATAGALESIVSTAHTGSRAAQLGSAAPTNGNSSMQQTVRVPAANASLSFWYQPHCPDSLTYDQQQMQIRSTSGAILKTVLNVCDNSGTWKQATSSLAAWPGQQVVLWFNSHDDNYPGDPTYLLVDDVVVSGTGAPPRTPPRHHAPPAKGVAR